MRLTKTLSRLKKVPRLVAKLAAHESAGRLARLDPPSDNPGNLDGFFFVPDGVAGAMPLVVVLHGCTQSAAAYDQGSGWSHLAERHGFALLFPEQTRANNPNLCFNWFLNHDTARGRGEAGSIAAQVAAMRAAHAIDPARIYVTGLSAGGAMASAMLATYPDVFAAGAIIAGLPYGCASGVGEAFECMSGRGASRDARTLGDKVRSASKHAGPWPRVSVWQGSADHTVAPGNADDIVRQWMDVHGLSGAATTSGIADGYPHSIWSGPGGEAVIERYSITGMGHGTPIKPGTGEGQSGEGRSGEARAHMLDAGISSTDRIADFFGLAVSTPESARKPAEVEPAARVAVREDAVRAAPVSGPHKVIEDALRAAGLMR